MRHIIWGNGSEIFAVEMCMTLTLTFKMGQGQIKICQSKGHARFHSKNVYDLDLNT